MKSHENPTIANNIKKDKSTRQAPLILEIKGNSLDDGKGIRSVVFFKGCPLRCIWCHNPESKHVSEEISYDAQSCIGCGSCIRTCPERALSPSNPSFIDREKCTLCYACSQVCPAKAIHRLGEEMSQEELVQKLLSDKPFYDVSGGGVTLSGGEATLFAPWVGELAGQLQQAGVNVLLETCGYFRYEEVAQHLLPHIRDIFCDIKIYDRELHKKYCGVYNDRILENFARMYADREKYGYEILPRIPLIPNITDSVENLTAIAEYFKDCGVHRTALLPYNPTWYPKNDKLGIRIAAELEGLEHWQSKEQMEEAREIFRSRQIQC